MSIRGLVSATVAIAIGAGAAQAQQREAVLQQYDLADAGFSIVIATAKSGGATADFRGLPDPNLVYLAAGNLVYAYTGLRKELAEDAIFEAPACSFHLKSNASDHQAPVVVYVISKALPTLAMPPRHPGSQ